MATGVAVRLLKRKTMKLDFCSLKVEVESDAHANGVLRVMTCSHADCGQKINIITTADGPLGLCLYGHKYDSALLRKKIDKVIGGD